MKTVSKTRRQTFSKLFSAPELHTVVVAFPDQFGRLLGKRLTVDHAKATVASGVHACDYLLTVDLDMNPLPGFDLANWDKGYGDFRIDADASTFRLLPWSPGTAMVLGDLAHHDGSPVREAPRSVLKSALERLAARGFSARCASELEFYLFREGYPVAAQRGYTGLTPSSDYLIDYHLLQTDRDEDVLARIRNEMPRAGVLVEGSKGEWGRGQHEVNLVYADALTAADRHVVFKHGVKQIAQQQGASVTFMAKWRTEDAGSSCHIHLSLWQGDPPVSSFADPESGEPGPVFRAFLGGLLKYGREFSYFFAPTVNAYKRYQVASWAPTSMVWSFDNRTTGFRVVGHGPSLRIENRMPGADVNPYLAYTAMITCGLLGIEEDLDCGDPYRGNAYADSSLARLPETLDESVALLDRSEPARRALGDDVVDYYVHTGRLEAAAFRREVTDWERKRYFEQI